MALGLWSRFQSLAFGTAIGAAASEAIGPALEPARQHAWSKNQVRLLDAGTVAEAVASGAIGLGQATDEAARNGLDATRVQALVYLALEAPAVAEAIDLRRRGKITPEQLDHAFRKAKIESQYFDALRDLTDERLDPAVIAAAIQRGIMADPGFLPVGPPTEVGKVPAFPVSPLDPVAEAAASGINRERLFVETALVGNPVGPVEAAHALFRGIIEEADFERAIAEGRTRNEWANVYREVAREILTTTQAVNLRLRGWIGDDTMYALTAARGMDRETTDRLLLGQGRPLSWHQVWIGLQRGGRYNGPTDAIDPAFLKALQESDIRPEWYHLAWAQRYSYPSAFVLRQLAKDGDLTAEQTETILLYEGWEPTLARTVAAKWAGSGTTAEPAEVKSARTKLLTALHKGFVTQHAPEAGVRTALEQAGYPAATIAKLIDTWTLERGFVGGDTAPVPGPAA